MNMTGERQHTRPLIPILSILALAMLACNAGSFLSSDSPSGETPTGDSASDAEDGSSVDSPDVTIDEIAEDTTLVAVTETTLEEALADTQVPAISEALLERYTPEDAFVGVAAALERGYSFAQIEAGALAGRLEADGRIVDENGTGIVPDGPPAGVLDISDLEAQGKYGARARTAANQLSLSTPDELLVDMFALLGSDSPKEAILMLLLAADSGYSVDQITQALILEWTWDPYYFRVASERIPCMTFFDGKDTDGKPNFIYPEVPRPCQQQMAKPEEEEAAEDETEPEEPVVDQPVDEGDLEAFCDEYALMLADLTTRFEAIGREHRPGGRCGPETCDTEYMDGLYRALETSWGGYLDKVAEVAPAEIKAQADALAAIEISTDGNGEEGDQLMSLVDDFAARECGISLQGLSEDDEE